MGLLGQAHWSWGFELILEKPILKKGGATVVENMICVQKVIMEFLDSCHQLEKTVLGRKLDCLTQLKQLYMIMETFSPLR